MVTANFGEMLEFFYTYTMIFMRGDAGGSPFRLHFAGRQTLRGNRIHQASVHMYVLSVHSPLGDTRGAGAGAGGAALLGASWAGVV